MLAKNIVHTDDPIWVQHFCLITSKIDSISVDPEKLHSPSRKELKQEKTMAQMGTGNLRTLPRTIGRTLGPHMYVAYCILRKLRIGSVNAQYKSKSCARFFANAQYMPKICARLYLFLQCARFAQDCTYFSYAQYMHKICARYMHKICARYMHKI